MKKILLIIVLLYSTTFAKDLKDATNEIISLDTNYNKIISLSPSATETIYTLKSNNKLIGVTTYCKFPKEAVKKEKIGDLISPNLEKIISLSPDLVIASKEDTPKQSVIMLRKLGINIFVLRETQSYNDIKQNFLDISKLINKQELANTIIKNIDKKISQIKHASYKPKVLCLISEEPLIAISNNTYLGESIKKASGINIVNDSITRYPIYNMEEVIVQNPDIIIIITMTKINKNKWKRFKQINAVKNNKVFYVDADKVCRPTPNTFLETVFIFKDLFNK